MSTTTRRHVIGFSALSVAAFVLLSLAATNAVADNKITVPYRYNAVWSTAVRFIRVDSRYEITDKDKESGYILFVFPGTGAQKRCPASLEVIHSSADETAHHSVTVRVKIASQPSYIEIHLLEQIERKLRAEQGPPQRQHPPRKKKKEEKPTQ